MRTERPHGPGKNGGADVRSTTSKADDEQCSLGQLAAEKVGEAASYVRTRGFRGLTSDLSTAAGKHPLGAIAVSLGVGYFIGRLMKRR